MNARLLAITLLLAGAGLASCEKSAPRSERIPPIGTAFRPEFQKGVCFSHNHALNRGYGSEMAEESLRLVREQLDVDLENTECLKLAISKALGIGIVGASAVVKVPQIIKLVQSRSASGISFLSYLLETSSYLISLAYNFRNRFPFSTYGETALVLGQNVIITVLVLNYSGRASMAALFVAVFAAAVATLFSEGVLDMQKLSYLQVGGGMLSVASKVPQIVAIWQQGSTGQLSAFAVSRGP